jgi:transglutaminase-like putative cysteine protease
VSSRDRLTLAAAAAVALGCAAVIPVYADVQWLGRALPAITVVATAGWLCRRFALPVLVQPLVTTAALGYYLCLAFAGHTLRYAVLPTSDTLAALTARLHQGLVDIDRLAPPVPSHPGLVLMAVAGVGAIAVVVDLVAVTLGRTAPAGLPLLVLYAVPSAVLPGGLGWLPFVLVSLGWLGLLRVEARDQVGRWGAPLRTGRGDQQDDRAASAVGRRIGAAALSVAVVVPALTPGLHTRLVGGHGGGTGVGSRTATTYNPITRLRDDLRLPTARDVLTYTTDSPQPNYLRLTTLDTFTGAGWSSSRLTGDTKRNGVKGQLPLPASLDSTALARVVHAQVRIRTLDAQWLPVPSVPTRVKVGGPWLYDPRSETVFGTRTSTRRLTKPYAVTAVEVEPSAAALALAPPDSPPDDLHLYTLDPGSEVTPAVRVLTAKVLEGATTPYARMAALQAFFTNPANDFQYSTSTRVRGIDSPDALEAFLRGRRGFCEQYASAMAAMARLAGVPARVGIGFTAGTRQRNGSYRVTTSDAHAWPEAWFAGSGWVRFEPTPRADGQTDVPAYTNPTSRGGPGAQVSAGPTTAPSLGATASPSAGASRGRLEQPTSGTGGATGGSQGTHRRLAVLAVVAALGVLAAAPWLLHAVRRRRRWRVGGALAAWQQLREDALDVGHAWRPADSPRAAAARLAEHYPLTAAELAALGRIERAVERARYARPGDREPTGLATDAGAVRSGLHRSVGRLARWRARLLPASTLRWASSGLGTAVADLLDRADRVWATLRHRAA